MTHINEHLGYDQISAFIDGELSLNEAREVEQHLSNCHSCTLRTLAAAQLKVATARVSEDFVAPPEALIRLAAQLRPQALRKPAHPRSFHSFVWAAIAASLLLAISLFGWRQNHQANGFAAELLDQHLAVLSSSASPEVLSTDRHTVKPWFQGKLPFSFNLPEALPADTTLKGADLTFLRGEPAALLLFTIHNHEVSVFLTQRSVNESSPISAGTQSGFAIHHANAHDLRIIAISDVNPSDLSLLMSALVEAQSSR